MLRMPGVVINLAGYIAGIHIIGKILGEKWKVLSAFILAILPYFIMQCRFGLDCNLLVNMLTISLCLLCLALEHRKPWIFLLTGVFYGMTYYAYALSYIPNTLLLLLITIYLFKKEKSLFRQLLCVWIPAGIIAFPLVLMILINQFDLPQIQIGAVTITKLPGYRGSEFDFDLPTVLKNIGIVLASILSKDWIDYNAFAKYYTMYRVSVPFIILGFWNITKHAVRNLKNKNAGIDYSLFFWMVFILYFIFGCFLGGNAANVNKMNGIFFAQFFLLMWGIREIYDWIARKHVRWAGALIGLLCVIYAFDFLSFSYYYFVDYEDDIYPQYIFSDTYEGILEYLQENHLDDRQIYVYDHYSDPAYIYYMLGTECDPYEVNLPEYGTECIGNVCFGVPDEVEMSAVYIIRETCTDHIDWLREAGLEVQYAEGMYQCYYQNN